MLACRALAGPSTCGIAIAIAVASCSTPKAPLTEPQAPEPFAAVVIECPPTLLEKDSEESGVFTASVRLDLEFARGGDSFPIEDACGRRARPVHVPTGSGRLAAHYEERVKQKSSVIEVRVNCELPTLEQEWLAGKTYVYRVTVAKRDAHGNFNSCNVVLGEAQASAPPAPTPSASASATP